MSELEHKASLNSAALPVPAAYPLLFIPAFSGLNSVFPCLKQLADQQVVYFLLHTNSKGCQFVVPALLYYCKPRFVPTA
jgi:hypothetical protein